MAMLEVLSQTLNPDLQVRKAAEKHLQQNETTEGYAGALLSLVTPTAGQPKHVQQVAAVTFKNFVKRNWDASITDTNRISPSDRTQIKTSILDVTLAAEPSIQLVLAEAISIIGRCDFHENWPEILPAMVQRFSSGDFGSISGVLQIGDALFRRYSHEMKSDRLWLEIKYVMETFAPPLTELLQTAVTFVQNNAGSADAPTLSNVYSVLVLTAKIYYSLSYQDLPAHFEDTLNIWMPAFQFLLKTEVASLHGTDDEPGLLEKLRAQIADNLTLYAQKYDEEFREYLPPFVEIAWNLLTGATDLPRDDLMVCSAMQLLSVIADKTHYRSLFESDASGTVLTQICERVVAPNVALRQSDVELFEDNPEEYIRMDIEGSDVDTRRRGASDLLRALCRQFEAVVTPMFSNYIRQILTAYGGDAASNWLRKDAAVFLVAAMSSKAATAKLGVTKTSSLIPIPDFYSQHIAPELANTKHPILQADALKFLLTFRSQLPHATLRAVLPACVTLLGSTHVVVHSYAAYAFERILMLRHERQLIITGDCVRPLAPQILQNIFQTLNQVEESRENEYLMKALMRVVALLDVESVAWLDHLLDTSQGLPAKLLAVAKNPTKPHFNHYLFETLCVLVRAAAKSDVSLVAKLEAALFPPIEVVLKEDVVEFMPYCFQIMALMLESYAGRDTPQAYHAILPFLLQPTVWERSGNIPALVMLLQSFVRVGGNAYMTQHVTGLLGIFQRLVQSRVNDHHGIALLRFLLEYMAADTMESNLRAVLMVLFQRLHALKTPKFVKNLIVALSTVMLRFSPKTLIDLCDAIQTGLFAMLIEKVFISELPNLATSDDLPVVVFAISRLLTECPNSLLLGPLAPALLDALIVALESTGKGTFAAAGDHLLELEEEGYASAYNQLAFGATATSLQAWPSVAQIKETPVQYLTQSLRKLSVIHPTELKNTLTAMDNGTRSKLLTYGDIGIA